MQKHWPVASKVGAVAELQLFEVQKVARSAVRVLSRRHFEDADSKRWPPRQLQSLVGGVRKHFVLSHPNEESQLVRAIYKAGLRQACPPQGLSPPTRHAPV